MACGLFWDGDLCALTLGHGASQLGLGHTSNVYTPTLVPAFAHEDVRVAKAACGQDHMVALSTTGNVRAARLCQWRWVSTAYLRRTDVVL